MMLPLRHSITSFLRHFGRVLGHWSRVLGHWRDLMRQCRPTFRHSRPPLSHSRETDCVKTHEVETPRTVIPAKAGIQGWGEADRADFPATPRLDSRFRGNDDMRWRCHFVAERSFDTACTVGRTRRGSATRVSPALLVTILLALPVALFAASPRVVTTVAPITSIVENVAGDRAEVTGIVPEGVNSHTFRPVPSDARIMARANLIILNGLYLEIPTLKLARANKRADTPILMLADRTLAEKDYVFDFSFPKDQGHPNPHLWPDPAHVMNYTRLVLDALIEADPAGRAVYEANAKRYLTQLDALDKAIAAAVATVPERNRRLLTYHDSWPYFAKRYGFTVIGAVQPSSFAEPSPREVARLIDQLNRERVPAVFGSEVFPSPVLQQIAREAETRFIDSLRDDDLPGEAGEAVHSYTGMMLSNIRTIVTALGGTADALDAVDPAPVAGHHARYR